jgi:hypothetical protein
MAPPGVFSVFQSENTESTFWVKSGDEVEKEICWATAGSCHKKQAIEQERDYLFHIQLMCYGLAGW